MELKVKRITADLVEDFFKFHDNPKSCGWCYCIAWWVPTWDGFMDRIPDQNRKLREELFDRGEFDGYLLYGDGEPIGWCQVNQRDRMQRVLDRFELKPDPNVWAITCFLMDVKHRRKGFARNMLEQIIQDLREQGVSVVEAYPLTETVPEDGELWNGPVEIYSELGFKEIATCGSHSILRLELYAMSL